MEKFITLTSPARRMLFMPAWMAAPGQVLGQTLYIRMLAHGATPEIWVKPAGGAGGGTALPSRVLPAAVLEVWLPWPSVSFGLGPLQRPDPSVLAQSSKLSNLFGAVVP